MQARRYSLFLFCIRISVMSSIRAILLDLDGVIAHTAPIVKQCLWYFFREKEIAILEKDFEEDGYAAKSLEQICDCLAEKYDITLDVDHLRSQIWDTQVQLMNEGLVFDPELPVLLELCRQRNIAIGIGSNSGWTRVQWIVNKMNIGEYFQTIVGAHDITYHKPDPEVWIQCALNLKVAHENCLVVDDGLPGLIGAKKCGMRRVYYHRYSSPDKECLSMADYHTDSFGDIIKLLADD